MRILKSYPVPISWLLVALGGVGLASGCRPDAVPATTAAKPVRPVAVATPPASNQPLTTAAAPTPLDTLHDGRLIAVRQLAGHLDALPRRAWSRVQKVELYESTEGGEAIFYYLRGQPQKITTQYLGETGQQRTIFYLRGGQPALVLVLERTYQYNRPMNYDSAAMRANADTEVFDFAKATIATTRSYFDHGQLLYQATSPANDSAAYLLREQRRLTTQLHSLLAQATKK